MALRRFLAAIFLVGALGLGSELILVGHFEDVWQQVPLVLIAAGVVALASYAARPNPPTRTAFRLTSVLMVVGGALGLGLHYQSNVEFELEMYPDLNGLRLVREALTGAIPALAPGALIQLGLIGLAYSYCPSGTHDAPDVIQGQEKTL